MALISEKEYLRIKMLERRVLVAAGDLVGDPISPPCKVCVSSAFTSTQQLSVLKWAVSHLTRAMRNIQASK